MTSVRHAKTPSKERSATRLKALGMASLAVLLITIAITSFMEYPGLVSDPASYIVWSVCIIMSLAYCQHISSLETASPHTLLPLLSACIILQQEQFALFPLALVMSLIYLCLIYRSIFIGSIHAFGAALASAPAILVFSRFNTALPSLVTTTLVSQPLSPTSWIVGTWATLAALALVGSWIVTMLYDTVVWQVLGYPLKAQWSEYSLSAMLMLFLADTMMLTVPLVLIALEMRQNGTWQEYAIAPVTIMAYAIVLQSTSAYSDGRRAWRRFKSIPTSEALRITEKTSLEETILTHLHWGYRWFSCRIVYNAAPNRQPFHSQRSSQPISYAGQSLRFVITRHMLQPPFTPYDSQVINAITALVSESLRVHNQLKALHKNDETDLLTGALSYRSFISYLRNLRDSHDTASIAIIYANIDHFKQLNAVYGHVTGNKVLHLTATRLNTLIGNDSILARVGGDEFAVVIMNYESRASIENLANQIHTTISKPTETEKGVVSIVASVGVSYAENTRQFDILLSEATELIYRSRATLLGTGHPNDISQRQASLPPNDIQASNPAAYTSDTVVHAIDNNTVTVVYQPIFDLTARKIISLSAQARISDPKHGCLPVSFIVSEAARLGLSSKLATNLLNQTMTDLEHFRTISQDLQQVRLPINNDETTNVEFLSCVERMNTLHPDIRLGLDLSEEMLKSLSPASIDNLDDLESMPNVDIGLNHVGTSFSEVAALTQIPAKIITIDKTVISNFRTDNAEDIMRRIVQLINTINMTAVFEGVDTRQQASFVQSVGGRYVQGSFYGSPLTASEFQMRLESIGLRMDMTASVSSSETNADDKSGDVHSTSQSDT